MPDMWWNSSCWHQFTNWWTILYGFGWQNLGERYWLWLEISCILCNTIQWQFVRLWKRDIRSFRTSKIFMCCMEKWFSYLITSIPQIYLNNTYCCICFGFVIKIDSEGCQDRWCYTECSIYQHSPVTEMEGKEPDSVTECSVYQHSPVTEREGNEVLMKLAAQSTLSRWPSISCHLEGSELCQWCFQPSSVIKVYF